MNPITTIAPAAAQIASAYANGGTRPVSASNDRADFGSMVGNAAEAALNSLRKAESTTAKGVAGKTDVQTVVEALGNAEITMQTVVAVRDKVVGAYNDIMRMAV